ncbi:MAG TPA: hypothetical protein DDZ55_01125, partial [Firmicutes bacterium]|nr:hypothetical protein [Bacillota bacterium]
PAINKGSTIADEVFPPKIAAISGIARILTLLKAVRENPNISAQRMASPHSHQERLKTDNKSNIYTQPFNLDASGLHCKFNEGEAKSSFSRGNFLSSATIWWLIVFWSRN